MNKFIKILHTSTFGCYLFLILIGCSPDNDPDPSKYTWSNANLSVSSFHPFFHEGFHYIFPYENNTVRIVKLDERNGNIVYDNPLFTTNEKPNFIREYFIEKNKLILPHERYIRTIDMQNGNVMYTDTMPHYLDRTVLIDGKLTAACYTPNGTFKFIHITKKNERYVDTLIYELDRMANEFLYQGFPPIYHNGRWIMGSNFSKKQNLETKCHLLVKDKNGAIEKFPYCYENNRGIGQSANFLTDENNIYVYCVDRIYSYRKTDFKQNWEVKFTKESLSYGPKLLGDKIYFLSEEYRLHVIDKNTGIQKVTPMGPVSSSKIYVFDDRLYFMGRSPASLFKVDLKTMTYAFEYRDEESNIGYDIGFSLSPNSKLLYNHEKWLCTPLDKKSE